MDTPLTTDEAAAYYEYLRDKDPKGEQVAAELNRVSIAHTIIIELQMPDFKIQLLRDPRWVPDPLGESYDQQPIVQQPTVYQPAAQQPTLPHPILPHPIIPQTTTHQPTTQQPAVPQPMAQQPTAQQSAVQQPGPGDRSCPVHGCNSLAGNTRLDHLWDHLAEVHGYERAANEYTVATRHMKRKTVSTLRLLFVRDIRKLAWNQARMRALEEAIRQHDQSYVSRHGFRRDMPHSITQANDSKKQGLIDKLVELRKQFNEKGKLYNQSGNANSTWDEVYANLVSTFQLDGNTVTAAERQAEQYFDNARGAFGDDTAQAVPPARVLRTDELVPKQGASLPPK